MWNVGKSIAHILNLIVDTPNLRHHPTDSTIELFDGGQKEVMTGITRYNFTDGSTAFHGISPPWEPFTLTIKLATGEKISIEVSPAEVAPIYPKTEELLTPTLELIPCPNCNNLKILTERYCRHCGQDSKTDSE
jgi:hypothetical protein